MTLIEQFLGEHPFFCFLSLGDREIVSHYLELFWCPKDSYLLMSDEEVAIVWLVVQGHLGEVQSKEKWESSSHSADIGIGKSNRMEEILRHYYPADLVNMEFFTENQVIQNELISLENDTQVISLNPFHLGKLSVQEPRIYRAIKPVYNQIGYLLSGLPIELWENSLHPTGTLLASAGPSLGSGQKTILKSYLSCFLSFMAILGAIIWNIVHMTFILSSVSPFLHLVLFVCSCIFCLYIILQRYRCGFILSRKLLHIIERNRLGLKRKERSYSLLSVKKVELMRILWVTRYLSIGGIRIQTVDGEEITLFPLDYAGRCLKVLESSIEVSQEVQLAVKNRHQVQEMKKNKGIGPKMIKKVHYLDHNEGGVIQRSVCALFFSMMPLILTLCLGLYCILWFPWLGSYCILLVVGLFLWGLSKVISWLRYTWRISGVFLVCEDNLLGSGVLKKIPLQDLQNLKLEYFKIFQEGAITFSFNDEPMQIWYLKSPQNVIDEIEDLRQNILLYYCSNDDKYN